MTKQQEFSIFLKKISKLEYLEPLLWNQIKDLEFFDSNTTFKNNSEYSLYLSMNNKTFILYKSYKALIKIFVDGFSIVNTIGDLGEIEKNYNFENDDYYYEATGKILYIFDLFKTKISTFDLSTPTEKALHNLMLKANYKDIEDIVINENLREPTEENLFYISLQL